MSLYFLPITLKSLVCVCFLFSATKVSSSSATCSNVSSSSLYVNLTTNFNFSHNPQEYYFRNGSLVILPNENPEVHFLCEAPYPIEWIQEYDQDQDGGIYKKDIYGERFIKNFSDPSSYTYQAVVGILYNGTTCHTSNFTCQSVSNPCNQKSVVSRLTGRGTKVIRFEVDGNVTEESNLTKQTSVNDSCSAYSYWGKTSQSPVPHFKCEASDGSRRPLEQMVVVCDSAMHCNTYYKHVNKGTKCLKFLPENHVCFGCGYLDHISYKPGFLLCIDNGAIVLAQHYFHSIPQGEDEKPDLYFSWNEVTVPQKMLFMEPIDEIVYSGQILTVHCQISRYYFSYGYRLALQFKNLSMSLNEEVNDGERIDAYQANRISFTFQVEPEMSKIICLAPVWNSTKWINQTVDLDVKFDSEAPSFKHPKTAQTVEFTKGDKNISIHCSAYGKPLPQIHIEKLGAEHEEMDSILIRTEIRNNTRRMEYRFPEAIKHIEGTYECTASNFRGSKTQTVKIIVIDEMFRILWTLIILGSLTVFIFLIIMGLCWKKINDQKAEIRLLTEAEIKEFIEGNPEAIQGANYLDTGERIDALPYNSKFEIPKERLYIDTTAILGSGAFGQVLKGSVVGEKQNGECLPVAVKTVKQNMEVMYFKSLLSEVKIMAHIGNNGSHANVVSLIGACTQNIRKREIFIAVEFCKNGSLENFLRKFRETGFLNLVKDDEIHMESTVSNHTNPYENCQNDAIRISTVHLIKWAREIANGMEFLGSKKIIHGDLAARNVLLADEYVAKIGDFGLSRQLINYSNYVTSQQCPLPWKWMAVESLCQMKFSVFTDVWAYGITLWEIFTLAQIPYPGISWSTDFLDHLVNGMRMHKPSYATNNIYDVMLECWNLEPTERPSFQFLKKVFEEILSEITPQEYFNPNGKAGGSSSQTQDGQGYLLPF